MYIYNYTYKKLNVRPQRSDESSGCPDDDVAVVPYATDRPTHFPSLVLFTGLEPDAPLPIVSIGRPPAQPLSEVRAIDTAHRCLELALAPSTPLAAQRPNRSSVADELLTDAACHVLVLPDVALSSKSEQTVRTVRETRVLYQAASVILERYRLQRLVTNSVRRYIRAGGGPASHAPHEIT